MNDKSLKFPSEYENPIDNFIIRNGKKLYPLYRTLNFTPNHLTFISMVLGVVSVYMFYKKSFILSAGLFFSSYSFDVFDGNYARTYDMITKFGDYFDHIKDLVVNVLLIIVFLSYSKIPYNSLLIIITLFLVVTMFLHLGCQEIYVKKYKPKHYQSEYLSFFGKICDYLGMEKFSNELKWLGCGTYIIWVTMIILAHHFIKLD